MDNEKQKILELLKEGTARPFSFKEMTKALNVPMAGKESFKHTLRELMHEGSVVKLREGRYGLSTSMNIMTGALSRHPDGYGFVIAEDGGSDLFISPGRIKGAMHGDRVVARIEGTRKDGKKEGGIIKILSRANKTIVGTFKKEKGFGIVMPSDERILDHIVIPEALSLDAANGMVVTAEITRWPIKHLSATGRVIEVLGEPASPDVEIEVILRKYGLNHSFSKKVSEEAASIADEVSASDIKNRVDLRAIRTFTIDGEKAKDFDDAVSIERTKKGFILLVSIADVSHYVKEGSDLDMEAFKRGTSVYFPDRCVPMLPPKLSNNICSLNPHVDRLTLTAELEFDHEGAVLKKRFYESVIKSAERLTYTTVKGLLEDQNAELKKRYTDIIEDLGLMKELALKLSKRRFNEGSIDFDLPEPEIIISIEGRIEDIVRSERNIAHRIIEEFMLSANTAVAKEFSAKKLPFIYRIHEKPSADTMEGFREFVSAFGIVLKRHGKNTIPGELAAVIRKVAGRPEEKLVNHVLLRSMKQAVYSTENKGHFGLAFEDYTHFTSPIRRYPDLIVHRLLKKLIHRKYSEKDREHYGSALPAIASQNSAMERKAMEAEREIVDLKKAQFMKDKEGEIFEGLVSTVTGFGLFVELKEYFVEGLVHITSLDDDYYLFDEKRHTLTGRHTKKRFSIGDPVKATVARVDIARRRIDLVLEDLAAGKETLLKRRFR
ncbi:MAG: ribonuclease R [Deltaproteobacteria bacterium]|nr:ribonuclease R [Deltaproteobacteria bacterium]